MSGIVSKEYRRGVRLWSDVITLTTANTSVNLYNPNPATGGVGQTCVIRKIMATNQAGADVFLTIGTGTTPTVAGIPPMKLVNGFDAEYREDDLPNVEFTGQITAMASATGTVYVQIEVEQYIGSTAHA